MLKVTPVVVVLLFACPAFAQNPPANRLAAAGCGANDVRFEVKTDKKQQPTAQPEAGTRRWST